MTDEPAAAPSTPATPSAPPPTPSPASRRRGSRGLLVFGVLGLVACLVVGVGLVFGRGWVGSRVDAIFTAADRAVERSIALVDQTAARLTQGTSDLDGVITDGATAGPTGVVSPALAATVATVAGRYGALRDGYVELRSRVESSLETARQVSRFVPFVDLPPAPTEQLAALDRRITSLDAGIAQLRPGSVAGGPVSGVVAGATAIRAAVGSAVDASTSIRASLVSLQARVADIGDTVDRLLWFATGGLVLIVVYVAILNLIIIRAARR